ncbi:MAG: hypothetical protein AABY09_05155 [Nanoarchaeota archaeon]
MQNLKRDGGTFKGIIGEYLFKCYNKKAILTRFYSKNKFQLQFTSLNKSKFNFLMENWYSIDALEFDKGNIILYEVKTRNKYEKELEFKPKMTFSTHNMYNEAKKNGFIVKMANVWLHDNWDYDVVVEELNESKYCIDKLKQYDKGLSFFKKNR